MDGVFLPTTMKDEAYSIFTPETRIKGAVAIVHGMAEHRGRYIPFAQYLADHGFGVLTYDLPGHGESVKEHRGYFGDENGWDVLVDSAVDAVRKTGETFPDVPLFLFGHSMGSIIARCFLQKHDDMIDGLILSGAPNYQAAAAAGIALGRVLRRFRGKTGTSKLMDQMVTGNFNRAVENPDTPLDWLSYDSENVRKYIDDPDCGFGFTIQGYIDELRGIRRMHRVKRYLFNNPKLPIAFFAGADDPCTGGDAGLDDSAGTLVKAGYRDISVKRYPGMRHEILNETGRQEVYEDIENWLEAHIHA
ncbi:MAG: lysophospholipase [Solobacterium sp.]|nr:lysophospholipase [Solobacterium sp.]